MHRSLFFLFLSTCFLAAEPALVLSESSLATRIHAQNPDLRAARWKIEEALGRLQQAGRPGRPRLDVEWEQDGHIRERELRVGVSRSFPVTQRLALEKSIGKAEVDAAEKEVRRVEQSLVQQARLAFFQALALKSRRSLLEKQQHEATEFAEKMSAQQQRAEASPLDAAQAKLDAARLLIDQRQLDAAEQVAFGELKELLGMRANEAIVVSGELPAIQQPAQGNIKQRADYQSSMSKVDAAQAEWQHAVVDRYDDLEAGVFLSHSRAEDAPNGYDRDVTFGFQLSIPLPFGNNNSGRIRETKAKIERRQQEVRALVAEAQNQAATATAEMQQWKLLDQQLEKDLMPLAREQLSLAEKSYQAGQGDLPSIIRARAQWRELALSQIDARREYHLARIRYEASVAAQP
jgi:cobalt-zinc-cadmium efflux system outer membrane protein